MQEQTSGDATGQPGEEPRKEVVAVKTQPPADSPPGASPGNQPPGQGKRGEDIPPEEHKTSEEKPGDHTAGEASQPASGEGQAGQKGHTAASGKPGEVTTNGRENQVVHTRSVSIKGVLKGQPRPIPIADEEISEDDQVDKAVPPVPEKIQVTGEMIRKAWKDYAASIEKSHPRIYTTLSQQEPTLNERGIIQINLNTEAQRENFIHRIKPELTRYFQKAIADVEYVFETNLVENETTVKKVYTDQDKLDYLINKNPALEKMKSKFNLDFDN